MSSQLMGGPLDGALAKVPGTVDVAVFNAFPYRIDDTPEKVWGVSKEKSKHAQAQRFVYRRGDSPMCPVEGSNLDFYYAGREDV